MGIIIKTAMGPPQNALVIIMLLAFSARDMDFLEIAKLSLVISVVLFGTVVICSLIGVIPNFYMDSGYRPRYCLGYNYPLVAPAIFFNITALYVVIKKEKMTLIGIVVLLAINYWIYSETDSRMSFLLAILMLAAAVLIRIKPSFWIDRKVLCWLMIGTFLIGAIVSIMITVNYNPAEPWQDKLNEVLTGRLEYGQESLRVYGVKFFGIRDIFWIGNGMDENGQTAAGEYLYVDCAYIQVLQKYGVLVLATLVAAYTLASYRCYRIGDIFLLMILAFRAVQCMIEDSPLSIEMNTFWIAIGILLFRKIDEEKDRIA